jgi:hypothetical protein
VAVYEIFFEFIPCARHNAVARVDAGRWILERKLLFLFMDVTRPFPYLTGLLNRMTIPAIAAASLLIRVKTNHEAWKRRIFSSCN